MGRSDTAIGCRSDALIMAAPAIHETHPALVAYTRTTRHRIWIVAGLFAFLLGAFVLDLATGPSGLGFREMASAILSPETLPRATSVIVWQVRLPVAVTAIVVGAALSLAGAEMQTILDNPLAEPFTLGVSSAASFGAALAIVLGVGIPGLPAQWLVAANAFLFAFAAVLVLQLLTQAKGAGVETLVLFGIALVFAFNALLAMLQLIASADALQQVVFWGMGSLARSDWTSVSVLMLILVLVSPWSFAVAGRLTALRLGEDRARSFGINVKWLRFNSLLRASLLAATAVAFVGTIGFIGLVGPHIARMLVGEDHRFYLPASALTGALVLSLASVASKIIIPGVLIPVGVLTALIGLPMFLALILRRR